MQAPISRFWSFDNLRAALDINSVHPALLSPSPSHASLAADRERDRERDWEDTVMRKPTLLLEVSERRERVWLTYPHTLQNFCTELDAPTRQYPCLVLCLGKHTSARRPTSDSRAKANILGEHTSSDLDRPTSKDRAMAQLLGSLPSGARNNFANIYLAKSSGDPIFLAESNPRSVGAEAKTPSLRQSIELQTQWKDTGMSAAINLLYSQLLFQFAGVVCLFADDYANFREVLQDLRNWIVRGCNLDFPIETRPHVLVVEYVPASTLGGRSHVVKNLHEELGINARKVRTTFASLYRVSVATSRDLQDILLATVAKWHASRRTCRLRFSATHLAAFFAQRLAAMAHDANERFDFIVASRRHRKVRLDLEANLINFITLAQKFSIKHQVVARVIASAVLLDAYPPGMHREYGLSPSPCRAASDMTSVRPVRNLSCPVQRVLCLRCGRKVRHRSRQIRHQADRKQSGGQLHLHRVGTVPRSRSPCNDTPKSRFDLQAHPIQQMLLVLHLRSARVQAAMRPLRMRRLRVHIRNQALGDDNVEHNRLPLL